MATASPLNPHPVHLNVRSRLARTLQEVFQTPRPQRLAQRAETVLGQLLERRRQPTRPATWPHTLRPSPTRHILRPFPCPVFVWPTSSSANVGRGHRLPTERFEPGAVLFAVPSLLPSTTTTPGVSASASARRGEALAPTPRRRGYLRMPLVVMWWNQMRRRASASGSGGAAIRGCARLRDARGGRARGALRLRPAKDVRGRARTDLDGRHPGAWPGRRRGRRLYTCGSRISSRSCTYVAPALVYS